MNAITETCSCGASITLPTSTAAERIGNTQRLADWRREHRHTERTPAAAPHPEGTTEVTGL